MTQRVGGSILAVVKTLGIFFFLLFSGSACQITYKSRFLNSFFSRMKLRKVCKTLRDHVDTTEFAFHDFHIHIRFHEVHLDSNNGRFEAFYKQIEDMKFAVSNNIKDGKNDRIFDFDELSNILENDLNIIFANAKRTVHSLTVTVDVN